MPLDGYSPCRPTKAGALVEIPWYVEFDQKYRDKGLAVIGVSMDDKGMKIVAPFLVQKKIEYRVVGVVPRRDTKS